MRDRRGCRILYYFLVNSILSLCPRIKETLINNGNPQGVKINIHNLIENSCLIDNQTNIVAAFLSI